MLTNKEIKLSQKYLCWKPEDCHKPNRSSLHTNMEYATKVQRATFENCAWRKKKESEKEKDREMQWKE